MKITYLSGTQVKSSSALQVPGQGKERGRTSVKGGEAGTVGPDRSASRERSSSVRRRSFVQAIPGISPDQEIQDFVNRNPNFPVQIQKVSANGYRFGRDPRTKTIVQMSTGNYVKIGGGVESLAGFLEGLLNKRTSKVVG